MSDRPAYPGIRVTSNGNLLVSYYTEARVADAGVFYPITPSTEMGELYQQSFAEGRLTVFGEQTLAIEAEGEHAAQGGAIACSVTGRRVVNFTSGQGIVYGVEQYYHAPGKLSTMVLEVAARALTKHALNVHCGHDDVYAALDTGWIVLFAKDAQQAADQALILRRVTEASLTPGMNVQDGFLTSHLERTFLKHEADLIRAYLGAPDDEIPCPTEAQRVLFGPTRRRVPKVIDLGSPALIGPVQNQEHYMNGVVARRNHFYEAIPGFLDEAYAEFARLTGRRYGPITEHRTEGASTVFVSLGSAAENIEAACDHLADTRGVSVGSIHVNVLRPFPEDALVRALAGRDNVIVLERTDEALASDNPLTRDVRTALSRAVERSRVAQVGDRPRLSPGEVPRVLSGVYGLGSRDFRPEGILGAYEFAVGETARADGARADDGTSYFTLGIDHPYTVTSDDTPSLLPAGAIAVRLHSIGGWGMITTGKNLGAIIGEFGDDLSRRSGEVDDCGRPVEVLHVSANPKYGSEKKGAPTAYFLVVASERIRVNCDLHHVSVVLCCDPKAFTHTNPLVGLADGGAFVWESDEEPHAAWERIPRRLRQEIIDRGIQLYVLPGFEIARAATDRADLRLRMQGNAFLGAFFGVSSFLRDYQIDAERFREVVRGQYHKKFGRFGEAVVESNMHVMTDGFERVRAVPHGPVDAPDRSGMRGSPLLPRSPAALQRPAGQPERAPMKRRETFDREFRAGLGYHQPASPLASVGLMAAATGDTSSKYVARRQTPVYTAENCTQCMDCITACPDTALPNTAQTISAVLETAIENYVLDADQRAVLRAQVPGIEAKARSRMSASIAEGTAEPFKVIVRDVVSGLNSGTTEAARAQLMEVIDLLPLAYSKTKALFSSVEKKTPGEGALFSIFVSDLCKGCGECVVECGEHDALRMVDDSEALNAEVMGAIAFLDLLEDTPAKYLGRFDPAHPEAARAGALKSHLMLRSAYDAVVSGDGACAGCGEKSVLRALGTVTEVYMRPIFHGKAARLDAKAAELEARGAARLRAIAEASPEGYARLEHVVAHAIMGLGGESVADTTARMDAHGALTAEQVLEAITAVLRQDAFNHRDLQAIDGRAANGMAAMAMAASTGCNTVYGSTPPNNPHPYPWMNSLFQDGATVGWMFGESFMRDHARRSVVPERLCDAILDEAGEGLTEADVFDLTHFGDQLMTDLEVRELPRVWCIGGDGALGDIGFQNLSKVILQNRPNVGVLMLDTQVYSNTGGQNSDSSVMPGGFDMNQIGVATQGKLTEKKSVAEILTVGHGSPYVAQLSMANSGKLYRAMLDALEYRGTAFFQCFTTCQPEHGVGDDMATVQATRIRDGRGMPDFVFNPGLGEVWTEALDVRGNPQHNRDWAEVKSALREGGKYTYTVAHWAATEARFRRHFKPAPARLPDGALPLEDLVLRVRQDDVVRRRHLQPGHRSYIPDFTAYIDVDRDGRVARLLVSRQVALFTVERRKAWRMLQSRAGERNLDYLAQKALLAKVDKGKIELADLLADTRGLYAAEQEALAARK